MFCLSSVFVTTRLSTLNVELKQKAGCLKEKIKTRTPPSELGICHIKLILCDTSSVLHFYNGYSNINDIKEVKCDEFKCLRQNTTRTKQTEIRDAGFGGKWRGCFILLLLNSTFSKVQKFIWSGRMRERQTCLNNTPTEDILQKWLN